VKDIRKSIVLVTVDCLRADHCGFAGYRHPTTPFLDNLARESFIFPTAIVVGVPTYYSVPAMLASRYPLALGREVLGLGPGEKNLASLLQEDGYATAYFGAGNPYLSPRFGYDLGFDTFRDFLHDDLVPLSNQDGTSGQGRGWAASLNRALEGICHKIPGLGAGYDELYFQYCQRWAASPSASLDALRRFPSAQAVVDQAQTWLGGVGQRPFFLWLHFMDPHAPYYPTEKGSEMFGAKPLTPSFARYLNAYWSRSDLGLKRLRRRRDEIVAMYDSGIRWVDAQISRLVDTLRQSRLWESCIFAFTADHGEEFLDHGGRYHAPSLMEELIHVPLLLRVPEAATRAVSSNPFSLLHLAPTLLAAAGSPVPTEFQGQSHWKQIQEGSVWNEPATSECVIGCSNPFRPEQRRGSRLLAIRDARYKLLFNFAAGSDCLFDLESDRGEHAPLPDAAAKPERRRLLEIAHAHLRRSSARPMSEAYVRLRLREIGQRLTNGTVTEKAFAAR
jgi:arylsulfatase A-like enzyme